MRRRALLPVRLSRYPCSGRRPPQTLRTTQRPNILQISYYADLLSSGGYQQSNTIQDYIYFTEQNNETKINVNKFLYIQEINKNAQLNSIYANVIKKDVYVDYETYQIQITNQTNQTILLDSQEENYSVILIDENEVEYPSNINEQAREMLIIEPQGTVILTLQFSKMYSENRQMVSAIRFLDIITNYEQYIQGEDKKKETINIPL